MTRILITGGCGFIGSSVVDYALEQGHSVDVIDNLSVGNSHWVDDKLAPRLHVADILDVETLTRIFESCEPDVVIHLAAHHYVPFCENNPYEAYRLNVNGTLNVLELCRRGRVAKFFFASTGDVYPPSFVPHREVDNACPIYIYGQTKHIGEQMCLKYFETHLKGRGGIIGRIFNAAGPGETNPHLIPEVVKQIAAGKPVIEVGNLWPKRDFVDVVSMAEVITELTLSASGVEIVNIGSGVAQEIGTVLATLKRAASNDTEFVSVAERRRPNDRPYLCPDTTRLERLIGAAAKPFDIETARLIFARREATTN